MRVWAALATVALAGCGRYADFTLPAPAAGAGATAPASFTWTPMPRPVLPRLGARDALNPSVVRRDRAYFNLFSEFDGRVWHTALATSWDGEVWTRQGRVLSPGGAAYEGAYIAANGHLLWTRGEFWYWYHTGPRGQPVIARARSADARAWRRRDAPVLRGGPRGAWDERGVADPYVIETGGAFYLYYLGQDRARRQRLGVARSRDGAHWEKLRANPLLDLGDTGAFDENGLGEPAVWTVRGSYWMLYTGRDRGEQRRLGLARSPDGVAWTRVPGAVFSGTAAWESKVICDPTVLVDGSRVRVWYGGGDVASPDENLNGQIGAAELEMRP